MGGRAQMSSEKDAKSRILHTMEGDMPFIVIYVNGFSVLNLTWKAQFSVWIFADTTSILLFHIIKEIKGWGLKYKRHSLH